jgi:hypothetical protein
MPAKTVYVRKTGLDANSGLTEALAKLTLSGGNGVAVAGDTIDIGVGTWTENSQLGLVSNVLYKGTGMFKTFIVGIPFVNATDNTNIYKFSDMYININTTLTPLKKMRFTSMERVYFDWTLCPSFVITNNILTASLDNILWKNVVWRGMTTTTSYLLSNFSASYTFNWYNVTLANNTFTGYLFNWTSTLAMVAYFRNCIFYNNAYTYFTYQGPGTPNTNGVTFDVNFCSFYQSSYNCNGMTTPYTWGANNSLVDPQFMSPASNNYNLLPTSPILGKGTAVP